MCYAIISGLNVGIYDTEIEAREKLKNETDVEIKTFKSRKAAEQYFRHNNICYFVVKKGWEPGIYTSKEQVTKAVKGYEGAFVKKFIDKTEAEEFFHLDMSDYVIKEMEKSKTEKKIKREQEKEEYAKRIEEYLKDGIAIHNENVCFIDMEANDGIGISLGAVVVNTTKKEIVDTFYSLMRYNSFKKIDEYVENIHHISTEDIEKAPTSDSVMKEFISFITKYNIKDVFSWGNSDKHYLKKSLTEEKLIEQIPVIRNVQTFISSITKDIILNKSWSLKDMKSFYGIEGEVSHNALDDAKDLAKVFNCFQAKAEINRDLVKAKKKN